MSDVPSDDSRPVWDSALAGSLVGKYVLIGLTYNDHNDKFVEQIQMHGTIVSADSKNGFEVELRGSKSGEVYWLPPHLVAFQDAPAGEYRLRSTGEIIVDPDFVSTWIINRPPPSEPTGSA